ncbi:hypothetical protein C8R44DRAFT_529853, partial [Mycena epipterygia]
RNFVLNYGLWVKGNSRLFDEAKDDKYDEKKRFDTRAMKIQGQLRDLEKFMVGVTSQRSNTSNRLRHVAGAAIFDCSATDLLDPNDRLEIFREQIGWYAEEGRSGAYSSLDVPILHADWSGEYDIKTCFLNPVLMRLYAGLIRGPSVVTAMLKHQKSGRDGALVVLPKSDTMEHIFGLDHTEPGAIAGSAVLAVWTLSGDTALRDRGDKTNIDYDARFDEYLEILLVGLQDGSQSILKVFREWDRFLFPNSTSG